MTDEHRPQPEFGQYATPQEQANAIAKSLPTPNITPTAKTQSEHGGSRAAKIPPAPAPRSIDPKTAQARGVRGDRLITMILLAVGFAYTLSGIPTYLSPQNSINLMYKQMGIGTYVATGATSGIGVAVIATQLLIWVLAAIWAFRQIRRGHASWWIPILAAVITVLVSAALLAVLLMADPAFTKFITAN